MKLTPRLMAIADMMPLGCRMADVGSDHGYLVAYLIEQKRVSKAIASDINQGPVDNAMSTLKENGLEQLIEVRLGGGLEPYSPEEIDVAVIAGMGGMLIRDIIQDALELAKGLDFLVLQPMTQQPELRRWLCEHGFEIFNETNVREGQKYYEIFCVRPGKTVVKDYMDYEIGFRKPIEAMSPSEKLAFKEFLQHKAKKYQKIKKEISHKGSEGSVETLALITQKLQRIEEVLHDVR